MAKETIEETLIGSCVCMKKKLTIIEGDLPQPPILEQVRADIERAKIDPEFATKLSLRGHTFEEADALMERHARLNGMKG